MHRLIETWLLSKAFSRDRRLANLVGSWLDYRYSLISQKAIVRHYPPALMIEPTNICNLRCPLCPSGNGSLSRARGMMPLGTFRDIIDQVADQIGMLILWNQGESFLNPEFYSMLEYAASKQLYTMSSTNASLPLDHARIIKSGLSRLIISMDGISEDTYNGYRVNGNYRLVLDNMQALARAKRELKSRTPLLVWQFIIMRHNEHEIAAVRQKAKEIGVDKLEFKTVQIYSKDDLKFLPTNHKLSRYQSRGEDFQLKTKLLNRCRRLWTQPVINWDGELSICCYDKDVSIPIGNIREHSFSELWHSPQMNHMRQAILNNRAAFEICRNCGEGIVQKLRL
jgi:radical SAM protein with 4Fe4S-binding SPASM domain